MASCAPSQARRLFTSRHRSSTLLLVASPLHTLPSPRSTEPKLYFTLYLPLHCNILQHYNLSELVLD